MNYLKLPSQKVLAKHLRCCTAAQETAGSEQFLWKCQLSNRCFTVSPSVWIQGTVVQCHAVLKALLHWQNLSLNTDETVLMVSDCGSKVFVDDGTGIVLLSECDKVPLKLSVTKGMYVMAVGSLQSSEECPIMVPIKLQDLSSIDHAETLWPLEVIDQLKFLKS